MLIPAAAAFFVLMLVAAKVTKKSLALLATEDKAKLVDVAAKTSLGWFLALVAGVVVWLWFALRQPRGSAVATIAALAYFLLLSALAALSTFRRYRSAGLPDSFLRQFLIARGLRLLGAVILFGTMALWLTQGHAG